MKRWIGPLFVLIISACAAHWAALHFAPSVIMDRALATLTKRNIALHAFTNPERITPQSQVVVRSSPDLYYALCRYDLNEPGSTLKVTMGAWADYQSLSFFDAETNNFLTVRGNGEAQSVQLVSPASKAVNAVQSPTARGVVLIRRLAPDAKSFAKAQDGAKGDSCAYEGGP